MYALPLICIALQDEMMMPLESGEGPLGLIICPSRELANQTVEVITQYTDALKGVRREGQGLVQPTSVDRPTCMVVFRPGTLRDITR